MNKLSKYLIGKEIPKPIKDTLCLIEVTYCNFDGTISNGLIVCKKEIREDLLNIFSELLQIRFPIQSVIPISLFNWDDKESVIKNNTSCFNYRNVVGSDLVSDHATGSAIDINPFQNPWVHPNSHKIEGRKYDINQLGTITKEVVEIFKSHGFLWGGDWDHPDYQHFYKN